MRSGRFEDLFNLIALFKETAGEGKMAIRNDQFRAYLQLMPDHHVCHIRLEYVCSLSANSCATMTDRLVQKIVEAGLADLPIICSFTNVKQIPSHEKLEEPAEKTITLDQYAEMTGLSVDSVLTLVKPQFLRIALPT